MKYTSGLIGDLSGSIGNVTASRNRGGNYLKTKSNPIQPNTQAQLRAKNNFGAASKGFGGLTSAEKSGWANYADLYFAPRNATNTGQYSGFQSFAALHNIFRSTITGTRTYSLEVNGAVLAGGDTRLPFVQPPPAGLTAGGSPDWDSTSGDPTPFVVTEGFMTNLGDIRIKCQVGEGLGKDMTNFLNAFGRGFGFAVYASNANPSDNMSYARPEQYLMGYFHPPVATVPGDLSSVNDFEFTSVIDFNSGEYQSFPIVSSWVNLTLFTIDQDCNLARVGSIESQVLSSLPV